MRNVRRNFSIGRRILLRGASGTAMSLPFLEAMLAPRAWSAPASPKRFLLAFSGSSIGQDTSDDFVPTTLGPNYDLKRALAPLKDIKNEISVVSGMKIPWSSGEQATGGPGSRPVEFHSTTRYPLVTGMSAGN